MELIVAGEQKAERFPFGCSKQGERLYFCVERACGDLRLNLYGDKKALCTLPFPRAGRIGSVWCASLSGKELSALLEACAVPGAALSYTYTADGETFADPYGTAFSGRETWAKQSAARSVLRTVCPEICGTDGAERRTETAVNKTEILRDKEAGRVCAECGTEAADNKTDRRNNGKAEPAAAAASSEHAECEANGCGSAERDALLCEHPMTDYADSVIYRLHVRGFTKDRSSGCTETERGTFDGVIAKLPYLESLGVTALELMPAYEYNELVVPKKEPRKAVNGKPRWNVTPGYLSQTVTAEPGAVQELGKTDGALKAEAAEKSAPPARSAENAYTASAAPLVENGRTASAKAGSAGSAREHFRVNYWGFTDDAQRFAPKASFGGAEGLKRLVRALHARGMELILGIYFTGKESPQYASALLRHWRLSYGIDGAHIVGYAPLRTLLADPYLRGMKLLADGFTEEELAASARYADGTVMEPCGEVQPRTAAACHDGFQNDMRRFLKGDSDMVGQALERIRANPKNHAVINYMANVSGFTMWDMLSYDRKHNLENGENNADGTDYNHSWNCGKEGPSRGKQITALRRQLYRTALVMTILSQGTPLINAGDEMCHTKKGNNNSWCQDNRTEWLDWKDAERNADMTELLRALIRLRQKHGVFRRREAARGTDYRMLGLPDVSFHGESAWKVDYENYRRQIGILYCGAYAEKERAGTPDDDFYIGYNMHWEAHAVSLPQLPRGKRWYLLYDTSEAGTLPDEARLRELKDQRQLLAAARSAVILIGRETEKTMQTGGLQ